MEENKDKETCCCHEEHEHCHHEHEEHNHCHEEHEHCCHEEHEHEHNHEHCHEHHHNHGCGCGCCHHHEHHHDHSHDHNHGEHEEEEDPKKEIAKIAVGAALLVAGLLTKHFGLPNILYYILIAASYVVLGWEVALNAISNLFHGELFDENFLMFIATVGAAALGDYTEAVSVMLFYDIGEFAQDAIAEKSRDNISALMDIAPEIARVINQDGSISEVKPEDVKVGQLIQVRPGERVPLDGTVLEGSSFVDMKAITGESVPVKVNAGSQLVSGSIVTDSVLTLKADTEYNDSTVKKILDLVEHAQETKAPTERFITKFAKIYTPIVIGIAALVVLIPSIITGQWAMWLGRALIFLVISCPCALVLSVPLAFFAGMGGSAKEGILIKGGTHLEMLAKTQAVAFDKTGTITQGVFDVQKVVTAEGVDRTQVLKTALALEQSSTHPIALSLVEYCKNNNVENMLESTELQELSGMGLKGQYDGKLIYAGNEKLMKEFSISIDAQKAKELQEEVGTLVYVASDNTWLGTIVISDKMKENVPQEITKLKNLGVVKTVMLSGDKSRTAEYVARKAGLDTCEAQLLPQQKVEKVNELKKQYITAYVGDGINDAPVIATADVGIAMGGVGSDSAIEASGVVIMTDDISKIPQSIEIARKTVKIAKQNIAFALTVKVLAMVLGALGIAGMESAIFADVGVALLAVLNSMRASRT